MPRSSTRSSTRSRTAPGGAVRPDPGPWTREIRALARAVSVSGILFSGLFVTSLVLMRQAPGLDAADHVYAAFYTVGRGNVLVTAGLYFVPFAGIAFLWHMGATRTLVDALPGSASEVPRWLQVTSGVLFVCMLFAGTAAAAGVALLTVLSTTPLPDPAVARTLTSVGYGMLFVFGVRAAGMYMITTTTLTRRRALLPRWVALLGYLGATFLLVSTTFHPATLMVFPAWVLLLSGVLLVKVSPRHAARRGPTPPPPPDTAEEHP